MIVAGDVGEIIRQVSGHHLLEAKIYDDVVVNDADLDITRLASQAGYEGGVSARIGAEVERAIGILSAREDVQEAKFVDGSIHIAYIGEPSKEWAVLNALVEHGIRIQSFGPQATDLEDVFMRVTKGIVS